MTTIDMLRNPSIRAVLTAAARIAPPPTSTRPAFTLRNVPAGISLTRAADLMEATAAAACERKQRAGRKGWHLRAKWHTLTFTFYWEPHPPADEPAVIAEAVDVLRAAELQAAIVRGADDDGPCTILMFNTIHPDTGLVHRSRDSYPDLVRWHVRREGVPFRLMLPTRIDTWSLTSLQQRLVKTGGRLVKHARYYWLLLAESHLTRRLFGSMLRRIWALPVPSG